MVEIVPTNFTIIDMVKLITKNPSIHSTLNSMVNKVGLID